MVQPGEIWMSGKNVVDYLHVHNDFEKKSHFQEKWYELFINTIVKS